jgi:hypothetical protein
LNMPVHVRPRSAFARRAKYAAASASVTTSKSVSSVAPHARA